MTENQSSSEIANPSLQREELLQNTRDPLPWLIRTLRQQQQKVARECPLNEPPNETQ